MLNLSELLNTGKYASLYSFLQTIPDFRSKCSCFTYELADLLLVMILAIMAGVCTQRGIARYLSLQEDIIQPSKSEIGRVCTCVDREAFNTAINSFLIQFLPQEQVVAIDGKSLNGHCQNTGLRDANMLYSISCYSHLFGVVLQSQEVEGQKGTEATVFRNLLNNPLIKVITADALHCNQHSMQEVKKLDKDYVFNCKRRNLLNAALEQGIEIDKWIDSNTEITKFQLPAEFKVYKSYIRKTGYFSKQILPWSDCHIKTLIHYRRKRKGKWQERFYVSSLPASTDTHQFVQYIKNHWNIENGLHWNKDVIFKEDKHKTKSINSGFIFSHLFSFVIGVYHLYGYKSLQLATLKHCNKINSCLDLLGLSNINLCNYVI